MPSARVLTRDEYGQAIETARAASGLYYGTGEAADAWWTRAPP